MKAKLNRALKLAGQVLSNWQVAAKLAGFIVALVASAFRLHLPASVVTAGLLAVGAGIAWWERRRK